MLELLLCSLLTIVPDYLYRRRVQGKTWGKELNFFTIWYELRWGLTGCLVLTVSLLTTIFYYHPATSTVTAAFRTVTILPEAGGRVAEVYVETDQVVEAGQRLFKLDDSSQQAAVATARQTVAELDAALAVAEAQYLAASGAVDQAMSALTQARDDLDRSLKLVERKSSVVSEAEVEELRNILAGREGGLKAAMANQEAVKAQIETLIPAQKLSAEAAMRQAEVELSKMLVYAGTAGRIHQFQLKPGDFVSPLLRPAGILVPETEGQMKFHAGFDQVSAQVIKPGMVGEMVCFSQPFKIIPMLVVRVQNVIAAGQFRPTDQLRDVQETARPGTVLVIMEPLYDGGAEGVPPGSRCLANVYSSFHDRLDDPEIGMATWLFYHAVDATAFIHAGGLRLRALFLPVQTLVLSGH